MILIAVMNATLAIEIDHRTEIEELTFRALALR